MVRIGCSINSVVVGVTSENVCIMNISWSCCWHPSSVLWTCFMCTLLLDCYNSNLNCISHQDCQPESCQCPVFDSAGQACMVTYNKVARPGPKCQSVQLFSVVKYCTTCCQFTDANCLPMSLWSSERRPLVITINLLFHFSPDSSKYMKAQSKYNGLLSGVGWTNPHSSKYIIYYI